MLIKMDQYMFRNELEWSITMLQTEQLQTLQAIILFTNKFIDIIFNIFRCQSSMAMQFSIVIELFLRYAVL